MATFVDIINGYFSDLLFQKVEIKDSYSLYVAKILSGYKSPKGNYIVLFVPNHVATMENARMDELMWTSIMIRCIDKGWPLHDQKLTYPESTSLTFNEIERKNTHVKYACETFPEVELLLQNDPKKRSVYQFPSRVYWPKIVLGWNVVLTVKTFGVRRDDGPIAI
jgi:hypothetical protein